MESSEIQERLARLDERLVAIAREIERSASDSDKALILSATEFQRRLEHLNGEAARLREMQATYLPRETWDRYKETEAVALSQMQANIDNRIKVLENFVANLSGKQMILQGAWALVVLIIASVLSVVVPLFFRG